MKSGFLWFLIAWLACPWAGLAENWKERLEVYPVVKKVQAPEGYQVLSAPGGRVIKNVSKGETLNTKAAVEVEGERYYMSDWSWTRYRSGQEPFWILVRGEKLVEVAKEMEVAAVAETLVPEEEKVVEEKSAEVTQPKRPLGVAERLEQNWDGTLEVFPRSRNIPAPKGYQLLANPDRGERALKSTSTRTSISVQAALTRQDGQVYYISDWSWSRAKAGHEPNWMVVTGAMPKTPGTAVAKAGQKEELEKAAVKAPEGGKIEPERVAAAGLGTASLVERVKQLTNPKVTLDGVDASGRVVALLVGNGAYSSANRTQQMLDLQDPALSVDLLGRTLRSLNAEVHVERDLNRERLAQVIGDTVKSLQEGDAFLFYYAGHALQLGGENYLVPLGINFLDRNTVRDTAYALGDLWKALAQTPVRFSAAFLDGCRKNPFNTKDATFFILSRIPGLNLSPEGGTKPGLTLEKLPRNVLVSFAAEPGAVMAEPVKGAHPSRYAAALAAAWTENVEIRDAMGLVRSRVSEWTGRQQVPWASEGDYAQFYLQTPGRLTLDPDRIVERAGQWVAREEERGLPVALGLLARSVRETPAKNPATAGLLFLLGYQSVPVPLRKWGPFAAGEGSFASEMQLSIDGRYVALFPAKGNKPALILDRDKNSVTSEVYDSFAPGYGEVDIVAEELGSQSGGAAGGLRVISFRRKGEGDKEAGAGVVYAMTPILAEGRLVASFYDEGLERAVLALEGEDKRLTFSEFATMPPVGCRENLRVVPAMPDLEKAGGGTVPLAAGSVTGGGEEVAQAWGLVFDGASGEVRFVRGNEVVYRRGEAATPGKRLEDWRLDAAARKIALIYRDQVAVLGLNGVMDSQFDLPPVPGGGERKVLHYNAAFRRLAVAWEQEGRAGEDEGWEIAFLDVSNGQRVGGARKLAGYADFAGLSPDQEWFFFYDSARRFRLVDVVSGGAGINFPGTATLQPLPVGPGLEPEQGGEDLPAYELSQPPLMEGLGLGKSSAAPPWLADFTEALIGFQVNQENEVEWLPDAPKKLEAVVQQMRKRPGDEAQKAWAEWLLANRLGLPEE